MSATHNIEADFAASELARQFVADPLLCYCVESSMPSISATASFEKSTSPWPKSDGVISILEGGAGATQKNVALEYKRQNEGIHGVLTAIGQAQSYMHKGYNGVAIVIPRIYPTHPNPGAYVKAVLEHMGGCPAIGVFHYDAPDLSSSAPFAGKLHCVKPFSVVTSAEKPTAIAGRPTTQWAHTREGSTTRDAFFRFLQTSKLNSAGVSALPPLSRDLVAAVERITPGTDPYWYLSYTTDDRFISSVWRAFWFNWVATPDVLTPWLLTKDGYRTPNAFTRILKDDQSGLSQIWEGRANGLKETIVAKLNSGEIDEGTGWEWFVDGVKATAGEQNKQGIRSRAHSYREDLDSSLAQLNWIDEEGRPTEFGYQFMTMCERYGGANSRAAIDYVGATFLQVGRFGAFLHYVHRLSEEIFSVNPLAYAKTNAKGELVFGETSYFEYLGDLEEKLANDLKVMRKVSGRDRPRVRTTFQAELTLLRNYGFISDAKYRLGVGLPIQWENVIEALKVEL